MRQPTKQNVPKCGKYPRGEKWYGAIEYRGRPAWVGTFATKGDWRKHAEEVVLPQLKAAVENGAPTAPPTVGEFAGVTFDRASDRVVPREGVAVVWPWTHRGSRLRKESTARRYAEGIRGFVREFESRPMDSFTRSEAREWARGVGRNTLAAVHRLFKDALDDDVISGTNPFRELAPPRKRRKDDPDFEVASDELFEAFCQAALRAHADDYARVLRALVLYEGTTAARPSELFAVEHPHIDVDCDHPVLRIVQQIDDNGAVVPVKNELQRVVPLSARMVEAYRQVPRLSERWAFPAPRGGHFKLSSWSPQWHTIRALAGRPDFEFYELKHRAITWMITPVESGGLGLDPATVAAIVGHQDGGITIARYYLKLDEKRLIERAHRAMRAQAGEEPG